MLEMALGIFRVSRIRDLGSWYELYIGVKPQGSCGRLS